MKFFHIPYQTWCDIARANQWVVYHVAIDSETDTYEVFSGNPFIQFKSLINDSETLAMWEDAHSDSVLVDSADEAFQKIVQYNLPEFKGLDCRVIEFQTKNTYSMYETPTIDLEARHSLNKIIELLVDIKEILKGFEIEA